MSELESCDWSSSEIAASDWEVSPEDFFAEIESCEWSDEEYISPAPSCLMILPDAAAPKPKSSCNELSVKRREHTRSKLIAVRRSPRKPKPIIMREPGASSCLEGKSGFVPEEWNFSFVMYLNGCKEQCITQVHGLTELDVLRAHHTFSTKSSNQQRQWLLDYFVSHCPMDKDGRKNPKIMKFVLSGQNVCQPVWMAVLMIRSSRFYELRKEFLDGKFLVEQEKRSRSLSSKSMQCIAWMENYFERIGDKRPDADGIYLPSCLTERMIYAFMVEEMHGGDHSYFINNACMLCSKAM